MLKNQRRLGADWDYRTANTKEYTHGIHPYPAMMIPQVARRLIREYGCEGGILLDPYCGTGTTLLEGMLAELESVGTDLNPLARLIARTKIAPIDLDLLDSEIENFIEFGLGATGLSDSHVDQPRDSQRRLLVQRNSAARSGFGAQTHRPDRIGAHRGFFQSGVQSDRAEGVLDEEL